jgi:hypothetical protein
MYRNPIRPQSYHNDDLFSLFFFSDPLEGGSQRVPGGHARGQEEEELVHALKVLE